MTTIFLVIHVIIAVSLVCVVLLQKSEGGGLGMGGGGGGGGGGMGGLLTGRGTANLLTRTTAALAAAFMLTSVTLAVMAGNRGSTRSIVDELPAQQELPAPPTEPTVPLRQ